MGSPPPDNLDKMLWNESGLNLAIDNGDVDLDEDENAGTTIKVRCPLECVSDSLIDLTVMGNANVRGSLVYTDDSSVCLAAMHAGVVTEHNHGLVQVSQGVGGLGGEW